MNKVRLLTFFSGALLVVNLVLIAFLFMHRPPGPHGPRGEGPKQIIIERLSLDAGQQTQYEELIQQHRSAIIQANDEMMNLKNALYLTLINPVDTLKSDSLAKAIAGVQERIEHINYAHFQALHRLCRPEQEKAFEALTTDLAGFFGDKRGH